MTTSLYPLLGERESPSPTHIWVFQKKCWYLVPPFHTPMVAHFLVGKPMLGFPHLGMSGTILGTQTASLKQWQQLLHQCPNSTSCRQSTNGNCPSLDDTNDSTTTNAGFLKWWYIPNKPTGFS